MVNALPLLELETSTPSYERNKGLASTRDEPLPLDLIWRMARGRELCTDHAG